MEDVVDADFWRGRRVLLTGHTGFKGAWAYLWLQQLGAKAHGFSLAPPTTPSLHALAGVPADTHADIRDLPALKSAVGATDPEIILHFAAQSLVRRSYADPIETFSTNVLGTANVLEAARGAPSLRAVVLVTSDKCYAARPKDGLGYVEDDPMGGDDPYSASKGCAELVGHAYRRSFFDDKKEVGIATVRAGNVIGGGDFADDRLVPDINRAMESGVPLAIRYPEAVRPWQHVLEPLSGYIKLAERLFRLPRDYQGAWNFGPPETQARSVGWVVQQAREVAGGELPVEQDNRPKPNETQWLRLNAGKACAGLDWQPRLDVVDALRWTFDWHRKLRAEQTAARTLCHEQIERYASLPPLDLRKAS